MATLEKPPPRLMHDTLYPPDHAVVRCSNMFDTDEATAWTQDTQDFMHDRGRIRDGTEHETRDHRSDAAVRKVERFGAARPQVQIDAVLACARDQRAGDAS